MKIDPKQIARMITEDPDEINPLDNTEDIFGPIQCDNCGDEGGTIFSCDVCEEVHLCVDCIMNYELHSSKNDAITICPSCKEARGDYLRESETSMANDKQHADNYFATAPKGMLDTMQNIIRKSVARGSIGMFVDMSGYTDSDKNKLSAYRVVAASMGITIGPWVLNRETGIARATITSS